MPLATRPVPQPILMTVSGSVSGQRSHDRGERVGEVGADDEIGEADLLPSPLDFLGGRRRVIRKYGQRVRCAKRGGSVSGGAMNGATVSPITGTWSASSTSRMARKSRASRATSTRGSSGICDEGDRICDLGRQRLGLRTAYGHHHRRVTGRGRRDLAAPRRSHVPGPAARLGGTTGSPSSRSWSSIPGLPVPTPISKRPSVSTESECASHAVIQAGRTGRHTPRCPRACRRGPRRGPASGQAPVAIAGRRASAASSSRCRRCGEPGLAMSAGQFMSGQTTPNRNGLVTDLDTSPPSIAEAARSSCTRRRTTHRPVASKV